MKKLIMMIALALMAAGVMTKAQTPAPAADGLEKVNASCPMKVSDGCVLESVKMADGNVVFAYSVSDEMFGNLEPMKDILHDAMVAEFMTTPDPAVKQVVAYCRKTGTGIVQHFASGAGKSFDLHISAADMK